MNSLRALALAAGLASIAGLADVRAAQLAPGRASGESQPAAVPPALLEKIKLDEHLGAVVPVATRFRTVDGTVTTLGDVLAGDLPTILTFNYTNCPSLCSVQLNALTAALAPSRFRAGQQYRLVTIVLAPDEATADAGRTRDRYRGQLGTDVGAAGWTFLLAEHPDDDAPIRAVADAVGFGYAYIDTQREYAHPAVAIALSPKGVVTRYVQGVTPTTAELDETILRAGLSEPSTSTGFLQACLHWDAAANSHRWGGRVMKWAALVFLALGAVALGVLVARTRRGPGVNP